MDADTTAVLRRRWTLVAPGAAAVAGLLAWRAGPVPEAAAYAVFGAVCVVLAVLDAELMRLPDAVTLPSYPVLAALLAATGAWPALLRGLTAALVLLAAHGLLAFVLAGAVGLGDAKAAGLAGLTLGFSGWPTVAAGLVYAYLAVGVAAVVTVAAGRRGRDGALPFGPFLLGGAVTALALAV